jgi:multidrug resistance efflux pump
MEKIIFFCLVIPIIGFVLYLGATAIMKGFSAKETNRSEKEEDIIATSSSPEIDQLSNEITKLNELRQSGVLTEEEFEKAKKRLLND